MAQNKLIYVVGIILLAIVIVVGYYFLGIQYPTGIQHTTNSISTTNYTSSNDIVSSSNGILTATQTDSVLGPGWVLAESPKIYLINSTAKNNTRNLSKIVLEIYNDSQDNAIALTISLFVYKNSSIADKKFAPIYASLTTKSYPSPNFSVNQYNGTLSNSTFAYISVMYQNQSNNYSELAALDGNYTMYIEIFGSNFSPVQAKQLLSYQLSDIKTS